MIEKIKEELGLLKDGLKVVLKLIFYVGVFFLFFVIMSYLWGKYTTKIQRQSNESLEDIISIVIPLILTGLVIQSVESKVKGK